jgi:hypothetical protein
MMKWAGHMACKGEMTNATLTGKTERKRPLGRFEHVWQNNIRIDLEEIGCMDWIHLAQDRNW